MMDHPNIAKVLDAGLTPNGQPFFVMELVNGLALNKFCDELKLTPNERLELFVPICHAVQHAHQKGIVHRDLKPANILITMIDAKPVPKVIDFGVAKATAGKLTDESLSTQFGAVVGTLEYMSPEQASFTGEDIDTRADIYSLGVILYELLTGLRPIDARRLKKSALTEMIRIIREEEPSKPSTRLSTDEALPSMAALRQIEPRRLMALLRGELDWVVMKCLEKRRERRYETASALARDIQRYLADEAVEARPASAGYRFSKFVTRNKGQVIAAGLVLLTLIGGMIGTSIGLVRADRARNAEARQREIAVEEKKKAEASEALAQEQRTRAEQREQQAIDAVKKFRDAVANNPELKNNPALETLRKRLLKEPLAFFKDLRNRLQADRDTRPESLDRLAAAGFELGALTREIGDQQDALIAYRECLVILQKLADANPAVTRFGFNLAKCHHILGTLQQNNGQSAEALSEYRQAIALTQKLADDNPAVTAYRHELAASHHALADLLLETGKPAEAEAGYRTAIKLSRKVTEEEPSVAANWLYLANHYQNLGGLMSATGRSAEAGAELRMAQAIFQYLADKNPADAELRRRLANCLAYVASVMTETGKPAEARLELNKAHAIYQELVDVNPTSNQLRSNLALSHYNLADNLRKGGQPAQAVAELRLALGMYQNLADENPTFTEFHNYLASIHTNLAVLLERDGKWAEMEAEQRTALAIKQKLADDNPSVTEYQSSLAGSHHGLGQVLNATGRPAEAEAQYRKAIAISQKAIEQNPAVARYRLFLANHHNNLGDVLQSMSRPAEAEAEYRTAQAIYQKLIEADPAVTEFRNNLAVCQRSLGRLLLTLGKPAEAETEFRKALALAPADASAQTGIAEVGRLKAVQDKLSAMLKGDFTPTTNDERLALAELCMYRKLYRTSVGLFADSFNVDPALGDNRQNHHRYNAACAASLAANLTLPTPSEGEGKILDDAAKAKLRQQALEWLKAELAIWSKLVESGPPQAKPFITQTLAHWKEDTDLTGIRDNKELAKLPEAQRKEWQSLWADVDALLKRTSGPSHKRPADGAGRTWVRGALSPAASDQQGGAHARVRAPLESLIPS